MGKVRRSQQLLLHSSRRGVADRVMKTRQKRWMKSMRWAWQTKGVGYKTHPSLVKGENSQSQQRIEAPRDSSLLQRSQLVASVEDMTRPLMKSHLIFTIGRSALCLPSAGNVGRSLKFPLLMSIYSRSATSDQNTSSAPSAEESIGSRTSLLMTA